MLKEKIGLGGSCHWCTEAIFNSIIGVQSVEQGWVSSIAPDETSSEGVIVHFAHALDRYSWVIPYYRLVVYSTQTFSIHANGNFISCEKNKNYSNNKKFIDKMVTLKNTYLALGYYDG